MPEYIIQWDTGYGDEYDIVEAKNEDKAERMAYIRWKTEIELNANYGVTGEATDDLKRDCNL